MNFLVVGDERQAPAVSRPVAPAPAPAPAAKPQASKAVSTSRNRRWSERHRFDKPGLLSGHGVHEPIDCLVRNLSKFGALIDLGGVSETSIPDCVELAFFNARTRSDVSCVVRWRNRNRVGVQFASATRVSVDRRRSDR